MGNKHSHSKCKCSARKQNHDKCTAASSSSSPSKNPSINKFMPPNGSFLAPNPSTSDSETVSLSPGNILESTTSFSTEIKANELVLGATAETTESNLQNTSSWTPNSRTCSPLSSTKAKSTSFVRRSQSLSLARPFPTSAGDLQPVTITQLSRSPSDCRSPSSTFLPHQPLFSTICSPSTTTVTQSSVSSINTTSSTQSHSRTLSAGCVSSGYGSFRYERTCTVIPIQSSATVNGGDNTCSTVICQNNSNVSSFTNNQRLQRNQLNLPLNSINNPSTFHNHILPVNVSSTSSGRCNTLQSIHLNKRIFSQNCTPVQCSTLSGISSKHKKNFFKPPGTSSSSTHGSPAKVLAASVQHLTNVVHCQR